MKIPRRLLAAGLAFALLAAACRAPSENPDIPRDIQVNEWYALPTELADMHIYPEKGDAYGIETDTAFLVETQASAQRLTETLALRPEVPFTVEKADSSHMRLVPQEALKPNTVYAVQALTASGDVAGSWAFQTKPRFAVYGTAPGDGNGYVEWNTGIEIEFPYEGVEIEPYFSISPEVKGRFLDYGKRVAFVPDEMLAPFTIYTVTLSGALKAPDGAALGEDYSFTFTTSDSPPYDLSEHMVDFYLRGAKQETFLTGDVPVVEMNTYNIPRDRLFAVEVYALTSTEYLAEMRAHNRHLYDNAAPYAEYRTPVEGRTPSHTFDTAFTVIKSSYGNDYTDYSGYEKYVVFPEPLEAGHYLVQITVRDSRTGRDIVRQKLIQVNDTSVYFQSVAGDNLLWLNDAVAGQPLTGAGASLLKAGEEQAIATGTTDEAGIASLETGGENIAVLHIPREDGNDYWDMVRLGEREQPTAAELYTAFAYTDRALYMPTDTVRFWGVTRGRQEALPAGTRLEVQLREGYGYEWERREPGAEPYLQSVPAELGADGTFIGQIEIKDLASGYYHLAVLDGEGRIIKLLRLEVQRYEKPEYQYSAYSDKVFYLPGEQVDINAQVNFFEGTPVWGMRLSAYSGYGEIPEMVTDADGHARVLVTPRREDGWRPLRLYYTLYPQEAERYSATFGGGAIYFPSDLVLQIEQGGTASAPTLTVKTNALDLSRIETAEDIYENYPRNFVGRGVNVKLHVTVGRRTYRRENRGDYYDWSAKQTRSYYRYTESYEPYQEYEIFTQNGQIALPGLPAPSRDTSYEIAVTATDSLGSQVTEYYTLRDNRFGWYYDMGSDVRNFKFVPETGEREYVYRDTYYDAYHYKLGQEIRLALSENNALAEMTEDARLLYTVSQDKTLLAEVTSRDVAVLTQQEQYLPNINVAGAYFDGRYVYPVQGPLLAYDAADEELQVSIEPDSARYRPGEEAAVHVRVRDKDNKGVKARLSVSVVDEAMFVLGEQTLAPAAELYAACYFRPVLQYQSHTQHRYFVDDGGGKGGGGGDGPVRSNFPDTALFLAVETDESGEADIEIPLPDNITKWRVTGVAVQQDALRAGSATTGLDASLPMFVQVLYNETYLSGDDVGLSARAYGDAVGKDSPVRYRAEIEGRAGTAFSGALESKGRAGKSVNMNFGELPPGEYTLTVRGSTNTDTDAVAYDFAVAHSDRETTVARGATLGENGLDIEMHPSRYPVVIGFADARYGVYFQAASRVLFGGRTRADQRAAAVAARRSMERFVDEEEQWFLGPAEEDLSAYVVYGKEFGYGWPGLALYPAENPDAELTAKVLAILGSDIVDKNTSIRDFLNVCAGRQESYGELDIAPEARAAAQMGLAAIGEPMLLEVRERLRTPGLLRDDEILYLCAALAIMGDHAGAKEVFDARVLPNMEQVGDTLRFVESGQDLGYRMSSLALMAASAMNHEAAERIARYVVSGQSTYYDPVLELAMYMREFRPAYEGTAQFQYRKNGKVEKVTLDRRAVRYISFMEEDLAGGDLKALGGSEVAAVLHYTGGADAWQSGVSLGQSGGERITLEREVRPATAMDVRRMDLPDNTGLGGLYTVTLRVRFNEGAPVGEYILSERIPSNLRFNRFGCENMTEGRINAYAWMTRERQNLTFHIGRYDATPDYQNQQMPDSGTLEIYYIARLIYEGDCRFEDALLYGEGIAAVYEAAQDVQPFRSAGTAKRSFS